MKKNYVMNYWMQHRSLKVVYLNFVLWECFKHRLSQTIYLLFFSSIVFYFSVLEETKFVYGLLQHFLKCLL